MYQVFCYSPRPKGGMLDLIGNAATKDEAIKLMEQKAPKVASQYWEVAEGHIFNRRRSRIILYFRLNKGEVTWSRKPIKQSI